MRKRYHQFGYRDGLLAISRQEAVEKSKRQAKKSIKFIFYCLMTALVVIAGYVVFSFFSAANNIFAGGVDLSGLILRGSLRQQDGITNILILGKGGNNHPGGQLTDTIMLIRLRLNDNKVAMISIPRDLYVSIPGDGESKINEAYAVGWNSTKNQSDRQAAGASTASKVVSSITGVPIHYYLVIDFVGFKDVVDLLGGITVNVQKDLYDPEYPAEGFNSAGEYYKTDAFKPLYIPAGVQTMNGEMALKFVRSRHGTGVSDFDRAARQQQVLYAIKEKSLSLGVLTNPKKIVSIASAVGDHVKTDMTTSEAKELFSIFSKIEKGSVINKVLDNSQDGLLISSNNGSSVLLPKAGNFSQIQAFVRGIFDDGVSQAIEIEVYNGSGVAGQAAKLAEKLTALGYNVTKVDNNSEIVSRTIIKDGTKNSPACVKIKELVGQSNYETLAKSGRIVVIIGQNYGN